MMAMRLRTGLVVSSLLVRTRPSGLLSKPNSALHLMQTSSISQLARVLSNNKTTNNIPPNLSSIALPTTPASLSMTLAVIRHKVHELFFKGLHYYDREWASWFGARDFSTEEVDGRLTTTKNNALLHHKNLKTLCDAKREHLENISAFRENLLEFQDFLVQSSQYVQKRHTITSRFPTPPPTTAAAAAAATTTTTPPPPPSPPPPTTTTPAAAAVATTNTSSSSSSSSSLQSLSTSSSLANTPNNALIKEQQEESCKNYRELYCIDWNVAVLPPASNDHLYNTALQRLSDHMRSNHLESEMRNGVKQVFDGWEHTMDVRVQQSLLSLHTQQIKHMTATWEQCGTPDFETQHHSKRDAVVTSGLAALASHECVYSGRPSGNPLDEHLELVKQVLLEFNATNTQESVLAMRTLREQRQIELGVETYEQHNFAEYIQAVKKEFTRDRHERFRDVSIVDRLHTSVSQELVLVSQRIKETHDEILTLSGEEAEGKFKFLQELIEKKKRMEDPNYVSDVEIAILKQVDTVYTVREEDWFKTIDQAHEEWKQLWACKPATKLPQTLNSWTQLTEIDQGDGEVDRQNAALEALMAHRDWNEAATGRTSWRSYLATTVGFLISVVASFCGFVFAWRRIHAVMDHTSVELERLWRERKELQDNVAGALIATSFAKLTRDERQPHLTTLFALLDDDDPRVRASALAAVGALTSEERASQIERVVEIMLVDPSPTTRAVAVDVFGSLTQAERHPHMHVFAPLLHDPHGIVRDEAAIAFLNFDVSERMVYMDVFLDALSSDVLHAKPPPSTNTNPSIEQTTTTPRTSSSTSTHSHTHTTPTHLHDDQPHLDTDGEIYGEAPRRRPLWESWRTMTVGDLTYEALKRTAESYESLTPEERVVVVASGAVVGSVSAGVAGGVAALYLSR